MKSIFSILFCLGIFTHLTAQNTATASLKFYHHEILFTPIGLLMGQVTLKNPNYAAGYRYHYNFRSALRLTHTNTIAEKLPVDAIMEYEYNSCQSIKLGYQYTLSKKPLHGLIFTDLLFINLQHRYNRTTVSLSNSMEYYGRFNEDKTFGVGAGIGGGVEWLIKDRIALLLAIDLSTYYGTARGSNATVEPNISTYKEYKNNVIGYVGDLTLSVSYRFK